MFCHFIVTRCFQKLSNRVHLDKKCWNVNVWEKIYEWIPSSKDLIDLKFVSVRWIDRPVWAIDVLPPDSTGPDGMTTREIWKSGQLVIQWEFSAATLRSWAWLLAKTLEELVLSVAAVKDARMKNETKREADKMENINVWCHRLYLYVHWEEAVVKTLLTRTSLAKRFRFRAHWDDRGM